MASTCTARSLILLSEAVPIELAAVHVLEAEGVGVGVGVAVFASGNQEKLLIAASSVAIPKPFTRFQGFEGLESLLIRYSYQTGSRTSPFTSNEIVLPDSDFPEYCFTQFNMFDLVRTPDAIQ